ncbi:MAG: hypothetical protein JXA23_06455 [Bacteroidales bacterium]|nr:hypothetical protein [Bacteroidales bacterium]
MIDTVNDTTGSSASADPLKKQLGLTIDLRKVIIRNGKMSFSDRSTGLDIRLQEFNFRLKGSFRKKGSHLDIRCSAFHIHCMQQGQVLANDLSMGFDTDLSFNSNLNRLDVNQASMSLNSVNLVGHGFLVEDTSSETVNVDLNFGLRKASLSEVLKMIPAGMVDQDILLDTRGEINVATNVKGVYGKDQIPLVTGMVAVRGEMQMNDVRLESSQDTFLFAMDKASLRLGSDPADTASPEPARSLDGQIRLNGMRLKAQDKPRLTLDILDLSVITTEPKEATVIAPVTAISSALTSLMANTFNWIPLFLIPWRSINHPMIPWYRAYLISTIPKLSSSKP